MSASFLELKQISRSYGQQFAVHDLNLRLYKGEITGLLGLNGAGKSTTLKMLSGLLAPSSGEIKLNGKPLSSDYTEHNRQIGYLPEQPPLYLDQTVENYLHNIARLYGLTSTVRKQAIARVLDQCDLSAVAKRVIGNLSKGYQQRIGIAQAILPEPEILILDEPTVGLDPQQLLKMRELLRALSNNCCIIFSSHILSEVQAIADRIVIMHQGKLVHDANNDNDQNLEQLFSDVIFGRSG